MSRNNDHHCDVDPAENEGLDDGPNPSPTCPVCGGTGDDPGTRTSPPGPCFCTRDDPYEEELGLLKWGQVVDAWEDVDDADAGTDLERDHIRSLQELLELWLVQECESELRGDGPLDEQEQAMVDAAWQRHKAARPDGRPDADTDTDTDADDTDARLDELEARMSNLEDAYPACGQVDPDASRRAGDGGLQIVRDVRAFHQAGEVPVLDVPRFPTHERVELRRRLLVEEAKELLQALNARNLVEVADGLTDLIYIAVGTALEFGIDLTAVWNEVHRSNMRKYPVCEKCAGKGCPTCDGRGTVIRRRDDGKVLKPEGWAPPDVAGVLLGVR